MDFDHLPGTKKLGLVARNGGIRWTEAEAKKCDVVCANCHRLRTAERRKSA
jgi:hypothetical protein